MAPEERFVCRFAAEPPQGPLPYGRWAETLQALFLEACLRIESEDVELGEARDIVWFPDRSWSGRTYVPVTAMTDDGFEYYGYVSFTRGDEESEPDDFFAWADFTDETADKHPEWKLDIAEEVVGGWRGEGGRTAAMTLVWGVPLLRGGSIATAELAGVTVDQCTLLENRFSLLAPDDYREDYLEVALYDSRGDEMARESLYEDDE